MSGPLLVDAKDVNWPEPAEGWYYADGAKRRGRIARSRHRALNTVNGLPNNELVASIPERDEYEAICIMAVQNAHRIATEAA